MFLFSYHVGIIFVFVIQCVLSETDLLIGQSCMNGGDEGRCTPWKKCLTFAIDKRDKQLPEICSYNGTDPIICCTSCHLVDDVTKAVPGRGGGIHWKNSQKSWNRCLSYMRDLPYSCRGGGAHISVDKEWVKKKKCHCIVDTSRYFILNGQPAARAQFPHLALLGYGVDADNVQEWVCTGSVISERYILTAGHCMSTKTRLPLVTAALGILKRSDPEELWQRYSIARRLPHPHCRPPTKYHDIALLRTDRTIQFNMNVLPACLPTAEERTLNDELSVTYTDYCQDNKRRTGFSGLTDVPNFRADAVGWGATGHREALSDVLQYVDLEYYNLTECSKYYSTHRHMPLGLDGDTQLCYGHSTLMHDTCDGDSGGPLQISSGFLNCQYTVIGVTSFGLPCGLQRQPGVYTRVQHYVPWIESEVWPED